MHLNLFYCNILVLFIVSCDSCPIFYSNDDNDPGEPLYLTKFIENGEIERVRIRFRFTQFLVNQNN